MRRKKEEGKEWVRLSVRPPETHTHTQQAGRVRMSAFHSHQRLALGPGSVCDK